MYRNLPPEWDDLTDAQRVSWLLAIGDRAEFVTVIRGQLPLGPDGGSDRLTVRELAQVVLLLEAAGLVGPLDVEE
jgi:hypothetical protein